MMIAASFLFVLLIAAEKLIVHKTINYRRPLRYLARIIFTTLLVITGISRMYFATHFLHQCVFGAILGMSISETFMFMRYVDKVQRMERPRWFKIGCSMAAMVTAIFWIHKLTNGNPMASVHMVCDEVAFETRSIDNFLILGLQVLHRPTLPQTRDDSHLLIDPHNCEGCRFVLRCSNYSNRTTRTEA